MVENGSSCNFSKITDFPESNLPFTYSWLIRDFQELYAKMKGGESIFSETFVSPASSPPFHQHSTFVYNHFKWKLRLYPRGFLEDTCVSLYLLPEIAKLETQRSSKSRSSSYQFDIFRLDDVEIRGSYVLKKLECIQKCIKHDFKLDILRQKGLDKFCKLDQIFPDNDKTRKTDLVIRVQFTDIPKDIIDIIDIQPSGNRVCDDLISSPSLEKYLLNETFSDVTFTFNCGRRLKASRIILASRSLHFEHMFAVQHKDPSNSCIIPINDTTYELFEILIYYLYTRNLQKSLSLEVMQKLYCEAKTRSIHELAKFLTIHLIKMINENTWDELLMMAWQTANRELKEAALNYVYKHWEDVKKSGRVEKIMLYENVEWMEELMKARFYGVGKYKFVQCLE